MRHAYRGLRRSSRRYSCDDTPGLRVGPLRRRVAAAAENQRANWNQLRLAKSPPEPVNVMNTVCTPVAEADRFVVTLPHTCQPPVLLTGTLAMIGPVVLSRRYCTVPVAVAPEARRVITRAAVV